MPFKINDMLESAASPEYDKLRGPHIFPYLFCEGTSYGISTN